MGTTVWRAPLSVEAGNGFRAGMWHSLHTFDPLPTNAEREANPMIECERKRQLVLWNEEERNTETETHTESEIEREIDREDETTTLANCK